MKIADDAFGPGHTEFITYQDEKIEQTPELCSPQANESIKSPKKRKLEESQPVINSSKKLVKYLIP